MIREADSLLEVCVNVTNGNNITDAGAEIEVTVVDQTTTRNIYNKLLHCSKLIGIIFI